MSDSLQNSFQNRVYNLCKKIPKGRITTYKDIAKKLNSGACRAVGNILSRNTSGLVPCHRVVRADSSISGFNRGLKQKTALLKKEGITLKNGKIVNFKNKLYKFE